MINDDPYSIDRSQLDKDDNQNVFIIMRYSLEEPFPEIEATIKETLQKYRLKGVLARDEAFYQQIWNQVRSSMENSIYSIVVMESLAQPEYNPNVLLELGYVLALRKPFLMLREKSLSILSTNIIGHKVTSFDSNRVKETVAPAIERWLESLGHSIIEPATVIRGDTSLSANKERTKKIIEELSKIISDNSAHPAEHIIRQAASLSSLAISDKEAPEYQNEEFKMLLLRERRRMQHLLEDGVIIRIVISPDTQLSRVRYSRVSPEFIKNNILPRYDQLINIIKRHMTSSNLQIVYADRLLYDNLLIIDEHISFIASKDVEEIVFTETTVVHDPTVIRVEVNRFENQFFQFAKIILKTQKPELPDYGSEALKAEVIKRLRESRNEVRNRLRNLPPTGPSKWAADNTDDKL